MSEIAFNQDGIQLWHGDVLDCLREMDTESVNTCVTSPPYWGLRDYGVLGQHGLEETPEAYIEVMVEVFREVKRVLRDDGTLWLNIGDSYCNGSQSGGGDPTIGKRNIGEKKQPNLKVPSGMKPKDLVGIPWMLAFALRADGWYLRSDIIWHKPNPMPESVTDRPAKAHEHIFLLSKSSKYYFDNEAIKEDCTASSVQRLSQDIDAQSGSDRGFGGKKLNGPMKAVGGPKKRTELAKGFRGGAYVNNNTFDNSDGGKRQEVGNTYADEGFKRNKRDVWTVGTKPFKEAHFATFNPELITPCILAGCPEGGVVLDPFMGSGTTAVTAHHLGRKSVGCELNREYLNDICIPRVKRETKQGKMF